MNLGNLIEGAMKQIELDKAKEAEGGSEAATDDELMELELFESDDSTKVLTDNDFEEFRDFEDELAEKNDELLKQLLGEK